MTSIGNYMATSMSMFIGIMTQQEWINRRQRPGHFRAVSWISFPSNPIKIPCFMALSQKMMANP